MKPGVERAAVNVLDLLRRAREFLLDPTPQNIDCCRILMARCAEDMTGMARDPELASGHGEGFKAIIRQVQNELGAIAELLASAARFRRDALKIMRAAAKSLDAVEKPAEKIPGKVHRVHVLG